MMNKSQVVQYFPRNVRETVKIQETLPLRFNSSQMLKVYTNGSLMTNETLLLF